MGERRHHQRALRVRGLENRPRQRRQALVTSDWLIPIGTAFGSNGELYALAQGAGEVVQIDLDSTNTTDNRTVIAEVFPEASSRASSSPDSSR